MKNIDDRGTVRDCDIWIGTDMITKERIEFRSNALVSDKYNSMKNGRIITINFYKCKFQEKINDKNKQVVVVRSLMWLGWMVDILKRDFSRFVECDNPKMISCLNERREKMLEVYEFTFKVKPSTY